MASIIEKYLDQIKKHLRKNSIDKEYIEEFTENLSNQLNIQLEEFRAQNSELSLEEAEIHILTNCEPVKVVVYRVVSELKSDEPRVKIDHFTDISMLLPVEEIILGILKLFDKGLILIGKKIRSLREWYLKNENPLLTSFFYLLVIVCSFLSVMIISFILPKVIYVTTYPDNRSYIFLYDIPSYLSNNPEITGISSTPLSSFISVLIAWLIVFALVAHIGWKYSVAYAIKTGVFLIMYPVFLWSLNLSNYRFIIKYRTIDMHWGISYTSDWIRTQKPSIQHYLDFLLKEMLSLSLYTIIVILAFLLLGSFLRTIIKERPILNNKRRLLKIGTILPLILICISMIPIIQQVDTQFTEQSNAPIPSYSDQPMLYQFEIDWSAVTSSRNLSENYITILPQFGGISFYFTELYNVTFPNNQNTTVLDLTTQANLSHVLEDSMEPSSSSQNLFPLFGLLYLPLQIQNQDWTDLVASHINSSFPFEGYLPTISSELTTIDWEVNNSEIALQVNTLEYISQTNASKFTFSFDTITGWLMYASLTLDNQSWVSGWDLGTLTITRVFTYNQIPNPEDYYRADTMLSGITFGGVVVFFCLVSIYYYQASKHSAQM